MVKKRGLVDFLIGRFIKIKIVIMFFIRVNFYDHDDVFKIKGGENFLRSRSPFSRYRWCFLKIKIKHKIKLYAQGYFLWSPAPFCHYFSPSTMVF